MSKDEDPLKEFTEETKGDIPESQNKIKEKKIYFMRGFSKNEKSLIVILKKIQKEKENLNVWFGFNFRYPITLILVSFIISLLVAYYDSFCFELSWNGITTLLKAIGTDEFSNIVSRTLFNGSLSLVALNALLSSSSFLLGGKILGSGNDYTDDINNLRIIRKKFNFKMMINFIIVAFMYVIQIAYPPCSLPAFIIYGIIITYLIYKSLRIAKYIYIIRDENYEQYSENKEIYTV